MSTRGNSGFIDTDKRFGTTGDPDVNVKGVVNREQHFLERKQGRMDPVDRGPATEPATGSVVWLDMDAANVTLTSGRVSTWSDISGNGNDANEGGSSGPTYNSTDSEFNNLPSASWLGSDYLEVTDDATLDFNGTGGFTVYVVANWDAGVATFEMMLTHTNTTSWTQGWGILFYAGEVRFWVNNWNTVSQRAAITWSDTTNTHIFKFHYDQTTITGQAFGPSAAVDTQAYTAAVVDASDGMEIGRGGSNTYDWGGKISEIIIYNSPLSTEDQTTTEEYLSNKYNISLT